MSERHKRDKKRRDELREKALDIYGRCCALCGITEKEFLAIDHADGGGCKHRLTKCGGGWNFCNWLKKNGYPRGYRTLCHNCNKRTVPVKEVKSAMQRWWKKLKTEVLTYYGDGCLKCCCCGEDDFSVLSLDHINGGGTAERKKLGGVTYYLYVKLRKAGFPEGYKTLCMNCNLARGFYGKCPHE